MTVETDTIHADELMIERVKAADMIAYNVMVSRHYDRIFARVSQLLNNKPVSYTHLTLPTIYSV